MAKGRRSRGARGLDPCAGGARWPACRALAAAVFGAALAAALAAGAAPAGDRVDAAQVEGEWRDYESQPLRVNVWHGRGDDEVYRRGEPVEIFFEANRDAYAVVYRIDTDGEVTVLWPRSRLDDGFVFGGHEYRVPASGAARLRASGDEGVEYVQAIVSLYPFDLRDLEVDFHHEENGERYRYRVAGDPFLAMNEVNFAITRLEDSEDYVVTNYVSYYVEREVAHPRYLCSQCHDDGDNYHPYDDTCVVVIHHDYGWSNNWFVRFGYYPVYYYPAYYYVDPWSWRPWINYWYTPWYWWPSYAVYDWPFSPYVWHYSPYWRGDCWQRWREGDRRYAPLDKRTFRERGDTGRFLERGSELVKSPRPTADIERALRTRTKLPRAGDAAAGDGGAPGLVRAGFRDVGPVQRGKVAFRDGVERPAPTPGLRVRDRDIGARRSPRAGEAGGTGADRPTYRREAPGRSSPADRSPAPAVRERDRTAPPRREGRDSDSGGAIRPVTPHRPGARIWSGGRSGGTVDRSARPAPSERGERDRDAAPSRPADVDRDRGRESPRDRDDGRAAPPRGDRPSGGEVRERPQRSAPASPPPQGPPSSVRAPSSGGGRAAPSSPPPSRPAGGARVNSGDGRVGRS